MIRRTAAFAAVALCLPALVLAFPVQIPYSGQIAESGVLVNGTRNLVVRIYDASSGGSLLDTETFNATPVTNGVYHLQLTPPVVIWTGADRWLGVSVNGGAELTPRTQVGVVPYAIRSSVAEGLATPPTVTFVRNNISQFITTSFAPYATLTINCPKAGTVSLRTSGWFELDASGAAEATLSQTAGGTFNLDAYSSALFPAGTVFPVQVPICVSGVLSVAAGSNTFYLNCKSSNVNQVKINQPVLIGEYFPN